MVANADRNPTFLGSSELELKVSLEGEITIGLTEEVSSVGEVADAHTPFLGKRIIHGRSYKDVSCFLRATSRFVSKAFLRQWIRSW